MTTENREVQLGKAHREDGFWVLRYERQLSHAREKVWRALTESDHLRHWLPTNLVGERREGAELTLEYWPEVVKDHADRIATSVLRGTIRVWRPPSVFEWTWDVDVLRFELEADGDDTRLTFTTWLGAADTPVVEAAAGYHLCLDRLTELLAEGTTVPIAKAVIAQREAEYVTALNSTDRP